MRIRLTESTQLIRCEDGCWRPCSRLLKLTPAERLHSYLARAREAVAGCRVGRLTADASVMSDSELHERVSSYFVQLIDLVTDVFIEDSVDRDVARRRATTVIAVIQGGYDISRALDEPQPMTDATKGLLELLTAEQNM